MHFQNKTWVSVLQSTQDVHVHGLAFLNGLLLFTDPKHHRICTHKDNQVQTWAGSDREGSQDGPVMLSSFGQPTGITTEREQNTYIVDTQMGSVKLLVDLKPTALFLSNIGQLYAAFGVHMKRKKSISAPIVQGVQTVEDINDYIQAITRDVQEDIGKTVTNGPEGTV